MAQVPPCKNPEHPREVDRIKPMVIVEQSDDRVVFACKACRDLNKVLSVQVRTMPRGWQKSKLANEIRGVEQGKAIRNRVGKILYFT